MLLEETTIPTEVYHLGVDSKFRDKNRFPNPHTYYIEFENVYKNVVSVELVYAIYERTTTDQYCNLQIEELGHNLHSNSNHISGSFAQLPMIQNINAYDRSLFRSIKIFEKPLSKLPRLSIRFLTPEGAPYPVREHFMRFEITCMKFNSTIEWKNMEMVSQTASMFHTITWNAEQVLGLPPGYTWETAQENFMSRAREVKGRDPVRYDELKKALKEIGKRFNVKDGVPCKKQK